MDKTTPEDGVSKYVRIRSVFATEEVDVMWALSRRGFLSAQPTVERFRNGGGGCDVGSQPTWVFRRSADGGTFDPGVLYYARIRSVIPFESGVEKTIYFM